MKTLAQLMADITRQPRYKVVAGVDFKWSRDCWVHNVFRVYELIFWRRLGVRAECAKGWKGEQISFTLENVLVRMEARLRSFRFPVPKFSIIKAPALITPNGIRISSPYSFAVAWEVANDGEYDTDDQVEFDLAVSGSSPCMMVGTRNNASETSGTVTVEGNSATEVDEFVIDGGGNVLGLYYYLGQTGAAVTVQFNTSAATNLDACAASYSGVDSVVTADKVRDSETGSNLTHVITTSINNSWVVMVSQFQGLARTAGADTARRCNGPNGTQLFDSDAAVTPAGSRTLNTSSGDTADFDGILVSIAPAGAGGGAVVMPHNLALLGVG